MHHPLRLTFALLLLALLSACGRKEPAPTHSGGHSHVAPHGGTLIELGAHAYNVELLRDRAAGKLTAWVLDGHAENFVRLPVPALDATATVGGAPRPLSLKAVANAATGETVGNTSQFEVQADWLKGPEAFTVVIPSLEIRGSSFKDIKATFPAAAK
jgi:hypothetical protein